MTTWIDSEIHPSTEAEVYTDLEGNVKASWPIPELGEASRHTIALPLAEAKRLAERILSAIARRVAREGPPVMPPTYIQYPADVPKAVVGMNTVWGVASPFCEGDPYGWWACATHGEGSFLDREAMASHVDDASDGPHLMAWRCERDGQVHAWAAR